MKAILISQNGFRKRPEVGIGSAGDELFKAVKWISSRSITVVDEIDWFEVIAVSTRSIAIDNIQKVMKHLLRFVLLATVLAVPASGNTYFGTFTTTYTELYTVEPGPTPGIPGLSVGDTFSGWYRYKSTTVDIDSDNVPDHNFLHGSLYLPAPFYDLGSGGNVQFDHVRFSLSVVDGRVADFIWSLDHGPTSANFGYPAPMTFNMGTSYGTFYAAKGTMAFAAPMLTAVPESGGTISLLMTAVLGLMYFRRRLR